jgi:hypothetical protein
MEKDVLPKVDLDAPEFVYDGKPANAAAERALEEA